MMVTDDDAQENHENKDDEEEGDSDSGDNDDDDDNNDDDATFRKLTSIDSSTSWSPRISTHRLCPDLGRMVTIMMMTMVMMVRMMTIMMMTMVMMVRMMTIMMMMMMMILYARQCKPLISCIYVITNKEQMFDKTIYDSDSPPQCFPKNERSATKH